MASKYFSDEQILRAVDAMQMRGPIFPARYVLNVRISEIARERREESESFEKWKRKTFFRVNK